MRSATRIHSSAKRNHRPGISNAFRCAVESLERRTLLASIVVDSTDDTTKNDGVTTLREAINTANGTTAADVITFNLGSGAHTINLSSALPTLTRPVQISCPGASLLNLHRSGTSNYRIFRITSDVVISGMTVSNARVNDSLGGAIDNEATLTMNDCAITGNAEVAGVGGGGIVNFGTLTLNHCTVSGNTSVAGGGLDNLGSAVISECTFSGNQATGGASTSNFGGGIYNRSGAQLTLTASTISGNAASYDGGGLYNDYGNTSVANCTFVDNTANYGGAIFQMSQTPMTVTNCTFTRNTAGEGEAILNATQLTLTNCTIVGNKLGSAGLYHGAVVCGSYTPTPVVTLQNNILAENDGSNIFGSYTAPNISTANTVGDNWDDEWSFRDDRGSDPVVGPLADNGGPTQTMALLPGSPCIDAGNNTFATTQDQRGFSRVSGPKVDYGAYEAQSVTVDNTGDVSDGNLSAHNVTLREAIEMVNGNPRIDIIRFADDVFSTPQTIQTAGLAVSGELDLRGPGVKLLTIRGPIGLTDVFDTSSNFYVQDLAVQNQGQGAAIDNHNILSLRRVVVSGTNSSGPGVVSSGATTVKYSTIMDNAGDGILNAGGSVSVYDSTLSRNRAAIRNLNGSVGLSFATISGNSSEGVYNSAGTVSASQTLIALNGAGDVVDTDGGTADLSSYDFVGTRDGDPMLMPLADNGGTTPTMALRPYSPCINSGPRTASYFLDQRGTPRSRIADIGAYEYTGPFNQSLIVTTTADEDNGSADPAYGTGTSLREALLYAGQTSGPDVITFDLGSSPKTIQISSGELRVYGGTTIYGPGPDLLTVRGTGQSGYGVFTFPGVPATARDPIEISGLTATGGKAYGLQILAGGPVSVTDCVISGNTGYGIWNSGAQLNVVRTTISGNSPLASGGGIYSSSGGSVNIDSSTISGNTAGARGGGIYLISNTATITQSTISGNTTTGQGGAIYLAGSTLTISRSTIANNTGNAAASPPAGGILNNGGNLTLNNTIVANNTGGDLAAIGTTTYNATYSFIGDTQGDPQLGPLADNGGPTQTMALLPGSPCINAGDPSFTGPPNFDQRGDPFVRVLGGRLDIGAFEVGPPHVLSMKFNYDGVPQQSITIRFSSNVSASLSEADLVLADEQAPVASSHLHLANYDPATNMATFTFAGFPGGSILPDGNYTLDLVHSSIFDGAGNMLADVAPISFFFLNGDANHDRKVNAADLGILSANWQGAGKTFSQGDFNYDNKVDISDLFILSSRWQQTLPPPPNAAPVSSALRTPTRSAWRQVSVAQ